MTSLLDNLFCSAEMRLAVTLIFVLGAALVWAVMRLKRNERVRQAVCDGEQNRARVRSILQHSREILFGFDLCKERFDYLSPSCLSLTGYTVKELEDMGTRELLEHLHPEDREKIHQMIDQLRKNTKEREWLGLVDYRFAHRDGQYRSFSDHLHVMYDENGRAVYLSGS
ncbi:MAG: PAS domain-containing protein, partial [Kiritimatiellales bacterium]